MVRHSAGHVQPAGAAPRTDPVGEDGSATPADATAGSPRAPAGVSERNRRPRVCSGKGDRPADFYNENDKSNPFGNLIDDRVYLSMWF